MTALSERRAGGTDVARLRPVRAGVSARAGIWLAALAPIAFLPGLEDRWSWPKLVLAVAALLFAVLAPATGRLPRSVLIGGAVVLAVIVLCAALGAAPLEQLLGRAPRYAGLVGLLPIAATVWTGARLLGPRADALAQATYLRACTVAAVALAAVAVLETFGARPIASDLDRPGSLAGNATDQGILGVILLAVTASVLIGSFRRVGRVSGWAATGAAAGVVAVAISASRAALLAMAIVLVALGIRWIAGSRRRLRDGLIAALVVPFALAVAFLLPLTRDRVLSATGLAGQTVGDRLQIWAAAVRVWQRSPWFGVGPGGFMDAVTRDLPAAWYRTTDPSTVLDSTHNLALQVLVDLGAVGAAVVVAVVVFCSRLAVRGVVAASGSRRDLLLGGAVAVLAAGVALLTTPASPTALLPLAMLAGALLAAPATAVARPLVSAVSAAVIAVWLAALVACTAGSALELAGRQSLAAGDAASADSQFQAAAALRPWDADIALEASAAFGGAADAGLAAARPPAARWSQRAVAAFPQSARAREAAGMVALGGGDAGAAVRELVHATELAPTNPRVWHERGVAELSAERFADARSSLHRATRLSPGSLPSWQALEEACTRLPDAACATTAREKAAELGR